MTVKRKIVGFYFEFFRDVDLDRLENDIRDLVKRKLFPPFGTMVIMTDHKGLKPVSGYQIIRNRDYPLAVGRYDEIVRKERGED